MLSLSNATADFIKKRRLELKLSQSVLSKEIGYKNGQFVSNIERNLCQFPVKIIKKLSDALMVSEDTIIELMVMDYRHNLTKEVTNELEKINLTSRVDGE